MSRRSLVLLGLGGLSLLGGLTGAMVLLGLGMGAPVGRLGAAHGVLMVLGFLGTMIALERAVALGRSWGFLAPLATGLGALSLMLGAQSTVAAALILVGGAILCAMYVRFEQLEPELHIHVQALGVIAWPIAVLLWLSGRPVSDLVPWLTAFLVLVIAGERLELSRLGQLPPTARRTFLGAIAVLLGGATVSIWIPELGARVAGVGLVLVAGWLATHDIARRTVRMTGVTRYIALCLLVGYAWLAIGGVLWVIGGAAASTMLYDARLHAIFLGFVISMVFGHAPVIIPAVLRVPLPYRPRFYAHLALLHVGLVVRVVGGDLLGQPELWRLGGVLNVIALLVFVGSSAAAVVSELYARRRIIAARAVTGMDRSGPERRRSDA